MNANNNNIIIRNTVIKAVFIGDEDTGKSSLVSTYFGNEFDQYIYRTIGTEKFEKKLDFEDKSYKIIIYDTPKRKIQKSNKISIKNCKNYFFGL